MIPEGKQNMLTQKGNDKRKNLGASGRNKKQQSRKMGMYSRLHKIYFSREFYQLCSMIKTQIVILYNTQGNNI